MKKIVFITILVIWSIFAFFSNSASMFKGIEQQNVDILTAQALELMGQSCYGGCKSAQPTDLCVECRTVDCPRLLFGSISIGYHSDCSKQ